MFACLLKWRHGNTGKTQPEKQSRERKGHGGVTRAVYCLFFFFFPNPDLTGVHQTHVTPVIWLDALFLPELPACWIDPTGRGRAFCKHTVSAAACPGCLWSRTPIPPADQERRGSSGRRRAKADKSLGVVLSVEIRFCQLLNDAFVLFVSVPSWTVLSAAIIKRRWQKPLSYLPRLFIHISAFCYSRSIKTTLDFPTFLWSVS